MLTLIAAMLSLRVAAGSTNPITMVEDRIGPSLIKIAVPTNWNGNVLLRAHGLVPKEWPLSADFSTNGAFFESLSAEGWMIAATSYRRNGFIVEEAGEDMDLLRAYITNRFGEAKRVFLVGGSMGGAVVIRLAETNAAPYAGALAVGTVLHKPAYAPRIPLLLMSNRNEINAPRGYAKKAAASKPGPACWTVDRDGHCNVTSAEELNAFRALVKWSETGEIVSEADGTLPAPSPASVAVFTNGAAMARVTRTASSGGSLDTEFTVGDMTRLALSRRDRFQVACRDKTVQAVYGATYSDVPRGEWVAFIVAETGRLRIARNYADAVSVLGCKAGDAITISRPVGSGN